MGLRVWDQLGDRYDHQQLADNFNKIDFHDHTTGRGVRIPTEGIADGAITSAKLDPSVSLTVPDNSIVTVKLVDLNVTTAKIADLAITTAKLADGSVTPIKLATNAVTTTKILDANVTTSKIADANVTKAKLATDALNAFLKLAVAANRKVNFGSGNPGSWGAQSQIDWVVPHGLGTTPVVAFAIGDPKATVSSGGIDIPITTALLSMDATNVTFRLRTGDGAVTSNADPVYWLAIG